MSAPIGLCLRAGPLYPGVWQDLGRALGEVWRELSEKERLPYTQRAKVDRERYENELRTIARNAAGSEAAPASSA